MSKTGFPGGHKSLAQTAKFYDKHYDVKGRDPAILRNWNRQPHRTVTWYPALVLLRGRVFEIGCGAGHFAAMCRDFGVEHAYGIDYSAKAIGLAYKQCKKGSFATFDALSPVAHERANRIGYDTAVMIEVLEHIPSDLAVIGKIPVGKTVVGSVPDFHCDGHVRWFATKEQVLSRYEELLDIDVIVEEQGTNSTNRWFIFRGTRI